VSAIEVILILGAYVLGCLACILWRLALDRIEDLTRVLVKNEGERIALREFYERRRAEYERPSRRPLR
jgi:hypothetical protein